MTERHTFTIAFPDTETETEFKAENVRPNRSKHPRWVMKPGKRGTYEVTVTGDTEIVFFKMRWADEISYAQRVLSRVPDIVEQMYEMLRGDLEARIKADIISHMTQVMTKNSPPPHRQDRKEWWNNHRR